MRDPVRLTPAGARGPRLLLRPFRVKDAVPLFEAIEVSRARIRRSVPWSPGVRSVADVVRRIRAMHDQGRRGEMKRYAVVEAGTGEVIGGGMLDLKNRRHGTAVAGAWLRQDRWGRGHGSEAAILLCHVAMRRLSLQRVEFWIDPSNGRSQRVPEGLGVPFEGTLRNHWMEEGRLVSSRLYALIRSDFRHLRPAWDRRLRGARSGG